MMLNTFKLGAKYPVYTGQVKAKIDAASEDKKILYPAYATDVELIAEKEGFQRYFKEGAWHYVVDNVGKKYWDENGTKHTITELGEELPEGALLEVPVIPPTVAEQTALSNAECSKRINAHWNQIGQINASLGIYGADDTAACSAWISSNRAALVSILTNDSLLEIDVTDDQYWPVFEDVSE
ncbi:hypothetical protein [Marinomonas primoryensis]|uniref:hypothetical protein n=1 Tax=Marinomonas primoryensis TaxID=178399 RepID=UPI00370376FA